MARVSRPTARRDSPSPRRVADTNAPPNPTVVRARAIRDLDRAHVPVPAVTCVRAKNYKSIEGCDVDLGPITLLVGHNGAGKSNFLDVLRFVNDSLRMSLEHAIRERGGIGEVRRRSRGHPTHFGMRLNLDLGAEWKAQYGFQVAARKGQGFSVQHEECVVFRGTEVFSYFIVADGRLKESSDPVPDEIESDRLLLPLASALPAFRRVYQVLTSMGFYNLNLDQIRALQTPDPGELLQPDGRNLGAVVRRLYERQRSTANRISDYLQAVVPGVKSVASRTIGPMETLEFRQEVAGDPNPWRYLAANVSDGTLRALGVLVAVFQGGGSARVGIPLVAIEEPEVAIHPGAAARLMDALLEASRTRQILATTHSPDLLDHPGVDISSVLVVEAQAGNTIIAPVEPMMLNVVREHLYTVGELLRLEQIIPDLTFAVERRQQMRLFGWDEG